MIGTEVEMKLFRMLYDVWPENDLLPFDPDKVTVKTLRTVLNKCGDPLLKFMFNELCDCWSGTDNLQALIDALDSVADEVVGVVEKMKTSVHNWGKELNVKT